MSAAPAIRRAAAEIEGQAAIYRIGNRSIHQFWHLFAAQFRHVLLAPQRRPDSGRVAWTWREDTESRPVTSTELTEVRRRLSESLRSLTRGFDDSDRGEAGAESIDAQVRVAVSEMVEQLVAQRDAALAAFVCRTDAGLMLHSWGASTAAKPFFPDAQNGEISGNVVIGAERPTGISVVLENAQGAVLTRTQSERDGAFRFLNIAPGTYRVRVLDRSEFPVEGIAVTMERESVTGLELRGKAADSPAENTPVATPSEISPPWYKRKWIPAVALLGALGIGGCIWNSSRTPSQDTQSKPKDSGWQSANGQLPGSEEKNNSRDDRKVGTDGAFSTLSSSLPPPKITKPKRGPGESDNRNAVAKASFDPADSNGERSDGDAKNKIPEAETKGDSRSPVLTPAKQPSSPQSSAKTEAPEKSGSDNAAGDVPGGDKLSPPNENLADGSKRTPERKKTSRPDSKGTSGEEVPLNRSPDAASALNPDFPAPNPGTSPSSDAAKPLEKKSPSPSQKKVGSSSPAADGTTQEAESSDAAKSNAAADSGKTNADGKQPGSRHPSENDLSHADSNEHAPTSDASPVPADESTATDSSQQNSRPKSDPTKKASGEKSAAQPQPNVTPPAKEESKNDEPTGSPEKKAAKPAGASSSKKSAPNKSAGDGMNSAITDSADTTQATQNPTANGAANSNQPGKSAKKSGPTPSSSPQPEQKSEDSGGAVEDPTVKSPALGVISAATPSDADLIQINEIHASRWNARMVQDLILPTRPLMAKEEDQMEAMRQKMRQERVAQMPPIFQHPKVKTGLIFEFAGAGFSETDSPQWRDESGRVIPTGSVRGREATLEWPDSVAPGGAVYVLNTRAGKTLARVEVEQIGLMVLKTVAAVRVRYWVGIETAPVIDVSARPLEWLQSTGEAIPASWSQDNKWLAGKGRRIEIPLDATSKRVGHYGISLVDPKTGWALSADVAFQ